MKEIELPNTTGFSYRGRGEEFEYYVERQFIELRSLQDKLTKIEQRLELMTTLSEQLGVEESTLATVIPELSSLLTSFRAELAEKEASIKTDLETAALDEKTIAEKNAELAAIQSVQEKLAPVVEKAKELVPATPAPESPPAETPPAQPAPEQPVAETPAPPETAPEVPVVGQFEEAAS